MARQVSRRGDPVLTYRSVSCEKPRAWPRVWCFEQALRSVDGPELVGRPAEGGREVGGVCWRCRALGGLRPRGGVGGSGVLAPQLLEAGPPPPPLAPPCGSSGASPMALTDLDSGVFSFSVLLAWDRAAPADFCASLSAASSVVQRGGPRFISSLFTWLIHTVFGEPPFCLSLSLRKCFRFVS